MPPPSTHALLVCPTRQGAGYGGPLVPKLVYELDKPCVLLTCPFVADNVGVDLLRGKTGYIFESFMDRTCAWCWALGRTLCRQRCATLCPLRPGMCFATNDHLFPYIACNVVEKASGLRNKCLSFPPSCYNRPSARTPVARIARAGHTMKQGYLLAYQLHCMSTLSPGAAVLLQSGQQC